MRDATRYDEEFANAITHGAGVVGSLTGGAVLISLAANVGNPWQIVGAAVFSLSLLLLYTASTVYHWVRHQAVKTRLQVLDHCAIFVLIAGTYTPFTLGSLRGVWGWAIFATVWTLAFAGITCKLVRARGFSRAPLPLYLAMGWLALIAVGPLFRALPISVLLLIVAGGLSYTGGIYFYLSRRIPYAHTFWHLFVLAGSGFHFAAVLLQILSDSPA
jgi:hemolysin III